MTDRIRPVNRRRLIAGLGGTILTPLLPRPGLAQSAPPPQPLALTVAPGQAGLRAGAETAVWTLRPASAATPLRFKRGSEIEVTFENQLPIPVALNWHGLDGVPSVEALLGRPSVPAAGKDQWKVLLRHAGTSMLDTRLLGDSQARPSPACALVVTETEPVTVDRDEVLLIEDFRLRADGTAIAPGNDPKDTTAHITINGKPTLDISARPSERLRLRIINGCQRQIIAVKIEDHDVRVMAIDGQPSEPFLARDGQLVLAPGSRIDAFVDALRPAESISTITLHDGTTRHLIARLLTTKDTPIRNKPLPAATALPSNGLPSQLDLKSALRVDIALGATAQPDWVKPAAFSDAIKPAFRVKRGRVVVLALTNRGVIPATFHLHGHHFRLLDRLDDGWKPFWLDTLLLDAGQTQRIAFAAENTGRWLMEAMAMEWAAPRLVRWYAVDQ